MPIMDIVLELTDTFITDHVYAYLFPIRSAPYDYPKMSANSTAQTWSDWTYTPATKFLQVQPSKAAYLSSMPRDDPIRQLVTLYFITWYVIVYSAFVESRLTTVSPPTGSSEFLYTLSLRPYHTT